MPVEPPPAGGNRRHPSPADLKKKAISCLNKLSDRDTFAMASAELETMAVSLSPDCYAPFLWCISHTDASHKSPVRRQCVRLLATLARTHANRLTPLLPKMLLSILRRLRDADSSVRSACVDAVSAAAASVTSPPFSTSFLKPLADAILLDHDLRLQTGAALCLAAAVDAPPDVDPAHLQRVLPRFLKLLRSDAFKAKPALLSAVASIARAGGARSPNLLALLVPALVDLLGSADWAARKAAAEALLSVADSETDLVGDLKDACLLKFEARRFDKVKAVRDSMNRMIEAWKAVHGGVPSNDNSHPDQSKSSSRENVSDGHFPGSCKNSNNAAGLESAASEQNAKTSVAKRSTSPLLHTNKASRKKSASDWKIEIAVPQESSGPKIMREGNTQTGKGRNLQSKLEVKRVLFDNNSDKKRQKFGGLKSHSRVVPLQEKESTGSTAALANATEEAYAAQKDGGDLSLIRKQLVQIENQQASLLDMLQKFIGSSQSGIRSLETRVRGLEIALDEITHDLAASAARTSSCGNRTESAVTCCRLPGADFLSSKFWRRNIDVGRYSDSRFSTSVGAPSFLEDNLDRGRFKNPGGFVVNPLAEVYSQSRNAEPTTGPNNQL